MLVVFFDPEADELSPQRKGSMFEGLAKRLAADAGYADLILRAKHSSLEYDIEGRSKLHAIRLVGEAKAHEANMPGQSISAFVGKLMPLSTDGPVHGLYISTSGFTAEGRDYLATALPRLARFQIELKTLVGSEIPMFFEEHGGYVGDETLRSRVDELYGLVLLDSWLVCTPKGEFLVASCGPDNVAAATTFAAFKTDGTELPLDADQVRRLKAQHADLGPLKLVTTGNRDSDEATRVDRLPAVVSGAGSFDYRFPAPPEHFIGREAPLEELRGVVDSVIAGKSALRAVQVLSRSGVGKSSLLLKAPSAIDVPFATIDGRNLRTPADVRLLVTEAIAQANKQVKGVSIIEPSSLEEAGARLEELGAAIEEHGAALVIQVDQFESTLRRPAVFEALLNLVETTTSRHLPLVWFFARKNDVAVTFDEGAQVDLGRLNQISHHTRLDDFSPDESRLMFDQLEAELGEALRPELANAISTFSAGFPWLHKRLCAHVLKMKQNGVSQRDLVQNGLRAEDLFEDDLAGLEEQDRALLRRMASYLPATASELAGHLESEITVGRLAEKLNSFLSAKLLRLSGDIYDAYNDVFKTYLITDQIPFETRYVFRVSPRAAIELLRRIDDIGPQKLSDFHKLVGGSPLANLNKLRELRLLGLIESEAGRVELSLEAQEALKSDALGELLRRRLRGNGLVVRALDLVASNETLSIDELVVELRREMPQVEVSDVTWKQYAKQLASWLHFASLAYEDGESLTARGLPADEELRGRTFSRGAFAAGTFIPTVRPETLVELLQLFQGKAELSRSEIDSHYGSSKAPGVIQDAVSLDLAEARGSGVVLGHQGKMILKSGRDATVRDLAQLALSKPNVRALVDAADLEPLPGTRQREIISSFGSVTWTDGTWRWRLGILRSWLVATGLVTSSSAGIRPAK